MNDGSQCFSFIIDLSMIVELTTLAPCTESECFNAPINIDDDGLIQSYIITAWLIKVNV